MDESILKDRGESSQDSLFQYETEETRLFLFIIMYFQAS